MIKAIRFDEIIGKTVKEVHNNGKYQSIIFEDETALVQEAVYDKYCEDTGFEDVKLAANDSDAYMLGLCTKEEYQKEYDKFLEIYQKQAKENRRQQYEELKKEFGE